MKTAKSTSVSVIVLTYKQTETLNLIVQSLNEQGYAGDIEVIVSDDGSPEAIAVQNLAVLKQSRHTLKYIWQPDVGYHASAARNNGIRVARNELLIFLDGDIIPFPGLIEGHVKQHKTAGMLVAGNRTWVGEVSGIRTLEELKRTSPEPIAVLRGKKENIARYELLHSPHPWRACFSANLSVRREACVLFDEKFIGWGPDDAEFCYRMCVTCGLIPMYDESIGSYHLESADAVGNVFRKNNHEAIVNYIRNTIYFSDRCPGLGLEDVFYGFARFKLNQETNTWSVIPRSQVGNSNLKEIVDFAKNWIKLNSPTPV